MKVEDILCATSKGIQSLKARKSKRRTSSLLIENKPQFGHIVEKKPVDSPSNISAQDQERADSRPSSERLQQAGTLCGYLLVFQGQTSEDAWFRDLLVDLNADGGFKRNILLMQRSTCF